MQEIRSKNKFRSWLVATGVGVGSPVAPPERRFGLCHCICDATAAHARGASRLIPPLAHGFEQDHPGCH